MLGKASDEQRLLSTWHAQRGPLLRLCLRWTQGRQADAEDLMASAFLNAVEACHRRGCQVEYPRAWWAAVVSNLARDLWRSRGEARVSLDSVEWDAESADDAWSALCARRDLRRALWLVNGLPDAQRRALTLRSLGHEYDEIAEALAVSQVNARKLVQLARDALRASRRSPGGACGRRPAQSRPQPKATSSTR